MKKSIALVLSLLTTSLVVACGGSDDNSAGGAGSSNSHAGSGNGDAGSSNGGADNSSGGGSSCAAPEGTSDTCFNCVKSSCSSQYSDFCSANCTTKATSSACLDASTKIGNCIADHCESECNGSGGDAGSTGNDTGGGGSGGGGAVTAADCQKLEPCCADLTNGPQEACSHIVSLNYGPSCLSTYSLYKCDSVIAAASKPKTTACKIDTECIQGPYATDAQASACTQEGGTASDTCPKSDVVGCCTVGGIEEICDYTGHSDPITEAECTAESGTFSKTP